MHAAIENLRSGWVGGWVGGGGCYGCSVESLLTTAGAAASGSFGSRGGYGSVGGVCKRMMQLELQQ
jgi:hypothetical protein